MTRDILNSLGEVIGQLTLPDETSEWGWLQALAVYTHVPPTPTAEEILRRQVEAAMALGDQIIIDYGSYYAGVGLTTEQIQDVLDRSAAFMTALMAGAIEVALIELDEMEEDEEIVTPERKLEVRNRILSIVGSGG